MKKNPLNPFNARILCTLILMFVLNFSFGQIILTGQVVSEDKIPLEFVNIGIRNQNIGTISDEMGNFSITIDSSKIDEHLTFSHIGFMEKTIHIKEQSPREKIKVTLRDDPMELTEVILSASRPDTVEIGTKSYSGLVVGYVRVDNDINKDIREFTKKIVLKKPSRILNVNINLFNVNIDSASFRINIYDIKNNMPNKKINPKNIVVHKQLKNGWNKFDIADHQLTYDQPIFISIEYLQNKKDEEEPFRYGGQIFGRSITRSSSLGTWEKRVGAKLAMWITATQ